MSAGAPKLGLIAGGGGLPLSLAHDCVAAGRELFVIRLKGFADPALAAYDGIEAGIAELGRQYAALKRAGCRAVCMAGQVDRPDFSQLKPDLTGLKALPGAVAAARRGDDALLRYLVEGLEAQGFAVEGAHQVMAGLTLRAGPLGGRPVPAEAAEDAARALEVARAIGALDVGQGAVVCRGVVLAVEAQEGTDAMLARVAGLPEAIRGREGARAGVLAKAPKPIQERRVDMPVIGPATVRGAAAAGLAGIVAEAGGALVLERELVAAEADRLGLFVAGVTP